MNLYVPGLRARAVVFDHTNRVLLVRGVGRNSGRQWYFPGGAVERGESPAHAALREVIEETSVVCDPATVVDLGMFGDNMQHFFFRTKKPMPTPQRVDPESEVVFLEFFDIGSAWRLLSQTPDAVRRQNTLWAFYKALENL